MEFKCAIFRNSMYICLLHFPISNYEFLLYVPSFNLNDKIDLIKIEQNNLSNKKIIESRNTVVIKRLIKNLDIIATFFAKGLDHLF